MDQKTFNDFARQGFTHVPVIREVLADCDTPLSIYHKLANKPYTYLFESASQGGEIWSRYSFIGLPARTVIRVKGRSITITENGVESVNHAADDPLAEIESMLSTYRVAKVPGLGRFFGGYVGFFGYDTIRYIEPKLADGCPPDTVGTPDVLLMESTDVVVFDNIQSTVQLITLAATGDPTALKRAEHRLDEITEALSKTIETSVVTSSADVIGESSFDTEFTQTQFKASVERIKEYILAGDVMQVVIGTQLSGPIDVPPLQLYRALRRLNPSPYMYHLDLDDFQIVGSSPEILARVDGNKVVNRPLAGTRRRGNSPQEDLDLEAELLSDPKEIAEHLMLIDLGRNDVGRVAEIGSVKVTDMFTIERYAHIMHIASHVEGKLAAGKTAFDVLRATLPVGTLSGSPKIRAMEIIDELEPVKRGVYAGAVGYIGWNGNLDTAIAIRTAVIKEGRLHIQVGAGIVADSIPELEWKECMNKARSMFVAAKVAHRGLKS